MTDEQIAFLIVGAVSAVFGVLLIAVITRFRPPGNG
jgi:hypothetical protein